MYARREFYNRSRACLVHGIKNPVILKLLVYPFYLESIEYIPVVMSNDQKVPSNVTITSSYLSYLKSFMYAYQNLV